MTAEMTNAELSRASHEHKWIPAQWISYWTNYADRELPRDMWTLTKLICLKCCEVKEVSVP